MTKSFPNSVRDLFVSTPNWSPPKGAKYSYAQKAGLSFEKKVGKIILGWIRSQGRNTTWGFRSQLRMEHETRISIPDFILFNKDLQKGIIFESKLTFKEEGFEQLYRYAPLVASVFQMDVVLCQVCKALTPEVEGEILSGEGVISRLVKSEVEGPFIWHVPMPEFYIPKKGLKEGKLDPLDILSTKLDDFS